jgi:small subunit ribosomal protein S5
MRKNFREVKDEKRLDERVLQVDRVTRVVKGGRRMRFRALVVVGDSKGSIGFSVAKANEVATAVKKASSRAAKHLFLVPVVNGTIPHETRATYNCASVLLKPAAECTSIVAGGVVRTICELAGIKNLLAKMLGSKNKMNNVQAVFKALGQIKPVRGKQPNIKIDKPETEESATKDDK